MELMNTHSTVLPQSSLPVSSANENEPKINLEKISETLNRFGVPDLLEFFTNKDLIAKRRIAFEKAKQREIELANIERQKCIDRYLANSGIPPLFHNSRINDFKVSDKVETAVPLIFDAIDKTQGLYIYGACGTGKTLLSAIIANEKIRQHCKQVVFVSSLDMIHNLNPLNHDRNEVARLRGVYQTVSCLIIDDVGTERPTPFTLSTYFDIINYRYNHNLQTIVTSNFAMGGLQNYFGVSSERIIRRLKVLCKPIQLF